MSAAETSACKHPVDDVHSIVIVSPLGANVDVATWCRACGAFLARRDVKDMRDLALSPWNEWQVPRGARA